MRLQPIVYTTSMDETVDWYAAVLGTAPSYRSAVWTSFDLGSAHLGVHSSESLTPEGRVALSLVASERLEALIDRLASSGIAPKRGIQEETFGRSIVLEDPQGLLIQVNEHER